MMVHAWRRLVGLALGLGILAGCAGQDAAEPSAPARTVHAAPSFACSAVEAGSIADLVCHDAGLAALDRALADAYGKALTQATDFLRTSPRLRAEQRGWIKGRDDCWKADDLRACVEDAYVRRIAELQAHYRLVPSTGPVFYGCDGNPANEIAVTFFRTEPPSLIAERGDSVSFMLQTPSGSGARYEGRNEMFREHQGEVTVRWGVDAPEMRCTPKAR